MTSRRGGTIVRLPIDKPFHPAQEPRILEHLAPLVADLAETTAWPATEVSAVLLLYDVLLSLGLSHRQTFHLLGPDASIHLARQLSAQVVPEAPSDE